MTITATFKNEQELNAELVAASIEYGGAWVYSVNPFSNETKLTRYSTPSKVPDYFLDLCNNTIAYKGELRKFTKAAQIREQNRGLGCE